MRKNITVIGAGYVGIANGFLLGLKHKVTIVDVNEQKINNLQNGILPFNDPYFYQYVNKVDVKYSTNKQKSYSDAHVIVIATNTNYDEKTNNFDLNNINSALHDISCYANKDTIIILKSTLPSGYTNIVQQKYSQFKFIFSPEFLREGHALSDVLKPDRIVVGGKGTIAKEDIKFVSNLLVENTIIPHEVPIIYMTNKEAEVVKLFANTYLAMRVAFVNELDTYCQTIEMETANVLDAIGYDKRIGKDYWNPSFGFGGYCLPKDTKQLKSEYEKNNIPNKLISNINEANDTRKKYIINQIENKINFNKNCIIGIYRLIAKKGINNCKSSATLEIANALKQRGYNVIAFEPLIENNSLDFELYDNFEQFEKKSQIIVANRIENKIKDNSKVYTVDVYNKN